MFRCIRYDVMVGARHLVFPAIAVLMLSWALLCVGYSNAAFLDISADAFGFADNVSMIWGGAARYELRPSVPFRPPLGWLLLVQATLFASSRYPYEDLFEGGFHSIIRSRSRYRWTISKAIWVVLVTIVMLLCTVIVAALWTLWHRQEFSALLHSQVASAIGVGSEVVLESTSSIIPFLSGVTVGLLSLSLFQLVMSLLAQPPIAILTCAVLLIFAAYTQTPLLVGNTLMFARWDGCVSSGVPFGASIVVAAATLTLSILISIVCVQRRDLLSRGTNL